MEGKIIPKEVVYDGTSTEACAAEVIDEFNKRGYLGTLDCSLCYDRIDPKLITDVLNKLGFPEGLANLMENVWTNILRYVSFEEECSEKPYEAGK